MSISPPAGEYTVDLEAFHGPLDLLLYLIRRAEVDVSAISVASITDQYLRFLSGLQSIDVDAAGEFLVIAATLIELKARLLSPGDGGADDSGVARPGRGEPENPAADLVRQLLRYKRYRDAAESLSLRREAWEQRWALRPLGLPVAEMRRTDASDIEDLSLFELVTSFARISATVQFDRLGEHEIGTDDTPIELYAADVVDRLRRADPRADGTRSLPVAGLFKDREKPEVIGLFLAVLELARQQAVRVVYVAGTRTVEIVLVPDEQREETESPSTPRGGREGSDAQAWDDDDLMDDEPDDDEELEIGTRRHADDPRSTS